jgi:hypothetical protein
MKRHILLQQLTTLIILRAASTHTTTLSTPPPPAQEKFSTAQKILTPHTSPPTLPPRNSRKKNDRLPPTLPLNKLTHLPAHPATLAPLYSKPCIPKKLCNTNNALGDGGRGAHLRGKSGHHRAVRCGKHAGTADESLPRQTVPQKTYRSVPARSKGEKAV